MDYYFNSLGLPGCIYTYIYIYMRDLLALWHLKSNKMTMTSFSWWQEFGRHTRDGGGGKNFDMYVPTVDGRNPANQLRLVVCPIIYNVLYIPDGAGFLPSTVWRIHGTRTYIYLLIYHIKMTTQYIGRYTIHGSHMEYIYICIHVYLGNPSRPNFTYW